VIEGIPLSSYEVSYRLLVPGLGALRDIMKTLASAGLQPVVLKRAEHIEAGELTPRQLEVLLFAYKKGYLDTPRKISLSEMASMMGIRATSLRDIIRRAIKKIIRKYLADMGFLLEE
jgi:predicted DNA binding protein